MKKILIVLLLFFISFISGCVSNETNIEELIISGSHKVEIGKVIKLDVDIQEDIFWESSKEDIATVKDGYVYGLSLGKVIITAYKLEDPAVFGSFLVNVNENTGENEETIILSGDNEVELDKTITLMASVTTDLLWDSVNPEIATVNNGVVKGIKIGSTVIRAAEKSNPLNYGTFAINVTAKKIIIEGLNEIRIRETITLNAISDAQLKWISSNDEIATVDNNGEVTPLRVGKVTITVKDIYSLSYGTFTLTVLPLEDIADTDYDYFQTKILSIDEDGYRMELLNVPEVYLSPNTEYVKWDGNNINPISIDDLYIGLENVYVAVGRQSKMIKKVMLDQEIGFSNIRVAIRNRIDDIADNFSLYHDYIKFILYSDTVIQTFDGTISTGLPYGTEVIISINDNKMQVFAYGSLVFETNKRIIFMSDYEIMFESIIRGRYRRPFYEGNLEVSLVNKRMLVVNDINIESYLTKVVPSEMPTSWNLEALKSQAVAARTYAYMDILNKSNDKYGYTVDDSTKSQVYNNSDATNNSNMAIEATRGLIMTYDNKPVQAFYYSSSSGLTASGHEVWIKDKVTETIPYLIGKNLTRGDNYSPVTFDYQSEQSMLAFFKQIQMYTPDESSPYHRWKVTMNYQQLTQTINTNIGITYENAPESVLTKVGSEWESKPVPKSIGEVNDIYVEERGESGVVISLIIVSSTGIYKIINQYNIRFTIRPKDAGSNVYRYSATNLDSNYYNSGQIDSILRSGFFAIEIDDNNVNFYGGGNGHGVGMSQYGANGLANEGKSYQEILTIYYNEIEFSDISYYYVPLNNYKDLLQLNN